MNPEALQYLENILKKDPSALTADDIGFLRARASYLTTEQKRIFAVAFDGVPEQPAVETPPVEPVTPVEPTIEPVAEQTQPTFVTEVVPDVPVEEVTPSVEQTTTEDHSLDPDWNPNAQPNP